MPELPPEDTAIPGVFGPGVLTTGSGQAWLVGDAIGIAPDPGAPCDAPDGGSYMFADGVIRCRCTVCPRCGHHTGNAHQGHYWAHCAALAARLRAGLPPGVTLPAGEFMKRATREFHFCCPGNCELEVTGGG